MTNTTWGQYNVEYALSPKNMQTIDNKVDDGMPATGWVIVEGLNGSNSIHWHTALPPSPTYSQTPTSGNCTANGAASYDETAQYNVAFEELNCIPVFRYR